MEIAQQEATSGGKGDLEYWCAPGSDSGVDSSFFFDMDFFFFLSLYSICYSIASVIYVLVFWLRGIWDLSSPSRG